MTDITELAQREKFEAWWERTQNNGNPPRFGWSRWRDGQGYKVDDDDSELDGMWFAWKAAGAELMERCLAAEARVVELDSRTVKLPAERFCPAEYAGSQLWSETEVWNKAITACADELRASGIKVEAE